MELAGRNRVAFACAAALCLLLAACGGGGGGGDMGSGLTPFPTAQTDELPPGARIDVAAKNLFQMAQGDFWFYTVLDGNGNPISSASRQVTADDGAGHVTLVDNDGGSSITGYVVSADGLLDPHPLGTTPASMANIIGGIFEYATPLYPVGAERRHVRGGPWGEDLDGDGIGESFRYEYTQVFLGFESVHLSGLLTLDEVAHFHNVIKVTLRPTAAGNTDYTITATEDAWFASSLGLIKSQRSAVDSDGVTLESPHTLLFQQGTVAGVNWNVNVPPPPPLDGSFVDVPLKHNALVYDAVRNVYYASVPGSVVGNGNSIATIDPATGQVSYSAPVGSEPSALAIAADASVLYVGLDGSGDVVRLALPTMAEQARVHMTPDIFGQSVVRAIAVSPVDPTVAAVRMGRLLGVGLLRDAVLEPNRAGTADYYGNNVLAFDPTGTALYSAANEATFFLNRFTVLADGLADGVKVTSQNVVYYPQTLSVDHDRVIAGSLVYDAADLNVLGVISGAPDCIRRRADGLLVCFGVQYNPGPETILLADPGTFVIRSSMVFILSEPVNARRRLVEGPTGQVAISYPDAMVRLFSSPQLLAPPTPPVAAWPVSPFSTVDGQGLDVTVTHKALVYDHVNNLYYASVPGSVIGSGNSIARIDPATGKVTHSAPVGSEPNALAIAADASALYVGLDGSGEVVRLALPSMAETGRARLPVDPYFGTARAQAIAVSPANPAIAAVSMSSQSGTGLLLDMVMQPNRTSAFKYNNPIAFDAAGTTLYGVDTSFIQLRAIQVLADGLVEQSAVTFPSPFGAQTLSLANNRLIAGPFLFDPLALTQTGIITDAVHCVPERGGLRLLCLASTVYKGVYDGRARVLIADPDTSVVGSALIASVNEPSYPSTRQLVQGPSGQVAISYSYGTVYPSFVRLFSSTQLP